MTKCQYSKCGKEFMSAGKGSTQKYCCHRHRQYAYLERRPPKPAKPVSANAIITEYDKLESD